MDKKAVKEHLEKGYIQARVLFEIIGKPKDYVDKAIKLVIKKIKNESKIVFIKEEFGDPEETKDGLWGTYCEAELLIPNIYTMTWMAFNFSPASIEIIEPRSINLKEKQLTDFMNDLLSNIHENNTHLVASKSLNAALQKNINAIMRNAILIALGNTQKTSEQIGKVVGVAGKDIESVLEAMIKEGRLTKQDETYKRA